MQECSFFEEMSGVREEESCLERPNFHVGELGKLEIVKASPLVTSRQDEVGYKFTPFDRKGLDLSVHCSM